MKLVDPGPQPPPFEVEYSELESDKPKAEDQNEGASSNAAFSNEATTETVAETQAAPVAVEASVSEPATDADVLPEGAAATPEETQEESSGEDTFGAGVDVGDGSPKPGADEKSKSDDESKPQSADGANAAETSDGGQKKRGKRPNRRRRTRRGQKKNDGSPPKSES